MLFNTMKEYVKEGFSFLFVDENIFVTNKMFAQIYNGDDLEHAFLAIEAHKDTIKNWEGDEESVQF